MTTYTWQFLLTPERDYKFHVSDTDCQLSNSVDSAEPGAVKVDVLLVICFLNYDGELMSTQGQC